MSSNNRINPYRTARHSFTEDDPEFLDSESLHLSGHDFDFLLDGSSTHSMGRSTFSAIGDHDDGGSSRLTVPKSACSSDIMDVLLASSKGSHAMEMDFDAVLEGSLRESFGKMSVDGAIKENDQMLLANSRSGRTNSLRSSSIRSRSHRARSPSPGSSSRRQQQQNKFQVNAVNFDSAPPTQIQQGRQYNRPQLQMSRSDRNIAYVGGNPGGNQAPPAVSSMAQSISRRASNASTASSNGGSGGGGQHQQYNVQHQQQQQQQQQRRVPSPEVLSMGPGGTNNNNNNAHQAVPQAQVSDSQYNKALQRLAESMKRTEESRSHVMMQRDMLTSEQKRALTAAKQQLNKQRIQGTSHVNVNNAMSPQQVQSQRIMSPPRTQATGRGRGSSQVIPPQAARHVSPAPHPQVQFADTISNRHNNYTSNQSVSNSVSPPPGPSPHVHFSNANNNDITPNTSNHSSHSNPNSYPAPHQGGGGSGGQGQNNDKSSMVAQFLSGSRGTLTTGLEQSRKQLSMYMGQVHNQTTL